MRPRASRGAWVLFGCCGCLSDASPESSGSRPLGDRASPVPARLVPRRSARSHFVTLIRVTPAGAKRKTKIRGGPWCSLPVANEPQSPAGKRGGSLRSTARGFLRSTANSWSRGAHFPSRTSPRAPLVNEVEPCAAPRILAQHRGSLTRYSAPLAVGPWFVRDITVRPAAWRGSAHARVARVSFGVAR